MKAVPTNDPRIRLSVEDLCEILERLRTLHEGLLSLLVDKERALVEVQLDELSEIRDREESVIRDVIAEEKERLLVTEELGDLLDHDMPSQITVSEMLPWLPAELATRLSDQRDVLREVALQLARQNSINRALIEHSIGHVHVFVSKLFTEESGGAQYNRLGAAGEQGGTFFMDRRV